MNVAGTIDTGSSNISANYFIGNGALLSGISTVCRLSTEIVMLIFGSKWQYIISVLGNANVFVVTGSNINSTGNLYLPAISTGIVAGSLGQAWVGGFNGSTQYLSFGIVIGTGIFTIEAWFYTSAALSIQTIASFSADFRLFVSTDVSGSTSLARSKYINIANYYKSVNQWTHIAVQRNSSNLVTIYINGAIVNQTTLTNNWNTGTLQIGYDGGGGTTFNGYISNFRYVSGIAVYPSAFSGTSYKFNIYATS
jgi:hypothetical protein